MSDDQQFVPMAKPSAMAVASTFLLRELFRELERQGRLSKDDVDHVFGQARSELGRVSSHGDTGQARTYLGALQKDIWRD